MTELIFATNNLHKLSEIKAIAGEGFNFKSLFDVQINSDLPEDFDTFEKNASQKAWYVYNITAFNCFADDSGLETDALNGEPGVFSARYSRIKDVCYNDLPVDEANIKKLLEKLKDKNNRKARFRTVISLIKEGIEYNFEGSVEGEILKSPVGKNGFGYDPIFRPLGYSKSFAEMDPEEKNHISHRSVALKKMIEFLKTS